MIQTKEELFIAELGGNPQQEIELDYGFKIKLKKLLKDYLNEQLVLSGVSNRRELLSGFSKQLDKENIYWTYKAFMESAERYLATL
jgi:hypothetical protein